MELKIYYNDINNYLFYLSRGKAIDDIHENVRRSGGRENDYLRTATLVVTEAEKETLLTNPCEISRVFAFRRLGEDPKRFYATAEAVKNTLSEEDKKGIRDYESYITAYYLDTGHLDAPQSGDPEFPYYARIETGDKGPFVRLNANPDRDGRCRGKVFFIDKKTSPATIVPCYVKVRIVKELERYGFVAVKYEDFSFDDEAGILDYLWAKNASLETQIVRLEGTPFGDFYTFAGLEDATSETHTSVISDLLTYRFCRDSDGEITRCSFSVYRDRFDDEMAKYVAFNKTFGEMLMEDVFPCFAQEGKSITEAILEQFGRSEFLVEREEDKYSFFGRQQVKSRSGRTVNDYWRIVSGFNYKNDALLTSAIERGIFVPYLLDRTNVPALGLNETMAYEFIYFSEEELKELIRKFSTVNAEADKRVLDKVAAGKLKFV